MSSEVAVKPPRMTQGGIQRVHLQKRPEISNTQHTSSYDDDADSFRRGPLRFPWKSKGSRRRNRVIEKKGHCNIEYKQISKKRRRFITDAYTTWLETLLMFAASFYVTWMIFAALYYLICWYHGDLLPEHMPGKQEESNWKPCF